MPAEVCAVPIERPEAAFGRACNQEQLRHPGWALKARTTMLDRAKHPPPAGRIGLLGPCAWEVRGYVASVSGPETYRW